MARNGELTPQQERFAREVASGKSQADAYRAAYKVKPGTKPGSIHACASELMADPKIALRVRELQAAAAERAEMTAADVLREAMRLARFDIRKLYREDGSPVPIHELDDETAAAVQAVEIQEVYEGSGADRVFVGYTKKYKVADKNAALEKLFKHFGLYEVDNRQQGEAAAAMVEVVFRKANG
ncbi:terminase small subunit [Quisquiliibacterium transsilvanicum]|uniref:Phage terminase small subunit n=1 Tax=Quisquiliibacterium transsilvanicum TaxID=1549638 RepID=A0A7W8M8J2_9BURK|nr:terminase small subunit [Quisquiliibacterium transsilvanicum]MBB5271345.1 phage terminase small subunit [Quisquiliibacterium transsilvanicum]